MGEKEKVPIVQKRLDFKDVAQKISKFTEKNIFEDAYNALAGGTEDDKKRFIELAGQVGLIPALAEKLWDCWRDLLTDAACGWPS